MTLEKLVEVTLAKEDDFLKVRETLTRIGVAAKKDNILYQSCHILHKQGKYYIVHFKELFELDGKPSSITDNDIARRNTIANLISEWGLVKLVDPDKSKDNIAPISQIKILPHKEKAEWQLVSKYTIGKKRREIPEME
jgi:Bacteriophage translational regulator